MGKPNKENMTLALKALKEDKKLSINRAAKLYSVSSSTLARRVNGIQSKEDSEPGCKKLTILEENVIVEHICDLSSRKVQPKHEDIKKMANRLLSLRGNVVVGRTWVYSFVKRQPKLHDILKKRLNRDKSSSPEITTPLNWVPKTAENLNEITEQANFMKHQVKNHYNGSSKLLIKAIDLFEESNKKTLHQIALLQLRNEELEKMIESYDKSV